MLKLSPLLLYSIDKFLSTNPEMQRVTTVHCHECMHYKGTVTSATGTAEIALSNALLEELAGLRVAYATFLGRYKEEVQNSAEAQLKLVKTLQWPISGANHSFQPCFDTLIKEKVSQFNITYLKRTYDIFPHDVR